jgi:hypothetical protein
MSRWQRSPPQGKIDRRAVSRPSTGREAKLQAAKPAMPMRPVFAFQAVSATPRSVFSIRDLAIIFAAVIAALGVALYFGWIMPIQAILAVVILIVAAITVTVFTQ